MDTFMKADIFFFVTTVCVALVTIGILITLYYVVRTARKVEKVTDAVGDNMKSASREVLEMAEGARDSVVGSFLFKKKRSRKDN